MSQHVQLVVIGTAYHTPTPDALEVLADVAIAVDDAGVIVGVEPPRSAAGSALLKRVMLRQMPTLPEKPHTSGVLKSRLPWNTGSLSDMDTPRNT